VIVILWNSPIENLLIVEIQLTNLYYLNEWRRV